MKILTITLNPALDLFLEVPYLIADRKMRCGTLRICRAVAV